MDKADWSLFKLTLPTEVPEEIKGDADKLALYLTKGILEASDIAIPVRTTRSSAKSMPKHILELIKQKKKARKIWSESSKRINFDETQDHLAALKLAGSKVKTAIKEFKNKSWLDFLDRVGPNLAKNQFL